MTNLCKAKQLILILFLIINQNSYSQKDKEWILSTEVHTNISDQLQSELLEMFRSRESRDYYVSPEIPRRKLRKSTKRLFIPQSDVLLLIDANLLGPGKNCLIVGKSGIYYRNWWAAEQPGRHFIPFEQFKTMTINKSIHLEIEIGGSYFDDGGSSCQVDFIVALLQDIQKKIYFAQQDTAFFDADWKQCLKAEASFYRIVVKQGDDFLVKDMYMKSNIPQMIAVCNKLEPLSKNGKCTYYYPSGAKSKEGKYVNNIKEGDWIKWTEDGKDSTISHQPIEVMPSFVGGEKAMMEFIKNNIKYPKEESKAGISGTCYVSFVVEKDGQLSEIQILRGVRNGPGCDAEALRVIKEMPAWIPGTQDGKTVRVQFTLPIKFTLR